MCCNTGQWVASAVLCWFWCLMLMVALVLAIFTYRSTQQLGIFLSFPLLIIVILCTTVPFCCNELKDHKHTCSSCNKHIVTAKLMGGERAY